MPAAIDPTAFTQAFVEKLKARAAHEVPSGASINSLPTDDFSALLESELEDAIANQPEPPAPTDPCAEIRQMRDALRMRVRELSTEKRSLESRVAELEGLLHDAEEAKLISETALETLTASVRDAVESLQGAIGG